MARTTSSAVEGILLDNYDGSSSLSPFVSAATVIVDRLVAMDEDSLLDSTTLEMIERYIAAHYYTITDPLAKREKIGKSEDEYNDRSYWEAAMLLDFTGNLSSLGKKQPKMAWLGLPPSSQTEYEDRD